MRDVASLGLLFFFQLLNTWYPFLFFSLLGYPLSSASVAWGGERERERKSMTIPKWIGDSIKPATGMERILIFIPGPKPLSPLN